MYNEQINAELYNKIEEEFSEYEQELWNRSSEAILSMADEYIIKRDIVRYLLDNNIPTDKAESLLNSLNPLEMIYNEYLDSEAENRYMSYISNSINKTANKIKKQSLINKINDASLRSEQSEDSAKENLSKDSTYQKDKTNKYR